MASEGVTKLVETTSESKHKVIDDIVKKMEPLKEKHMHFRNECKTWISTRNLLNSELKELAEKIKTIKSQRDVVNDEVRNLKNSRDKLREDISDSDREPYRSSNDRGVHARDRGISNYFTIEQSISPLKTYELCL